MRVVVFFIISSLLLITTSLISSLLLITTSLANPPQLQELEKLQKQLEKLQRELQALNREQQKERQIGTITINDTSKPWYFKMVWFDAGALSEIYYQVNDGKPVLLGTFQGSLGEIKAPPVKIPNLREGDRVKFLIRTYWEGRWFGPVDSNNPKFFIVKEISPSKYSFQFEDAASADSAYNDGKFVFYQGEEQEFNNGLVAYWSFDNCSAEDSAGNGYNGKIHGNPECVSGVKGKALAFNLKSVGDNGCGQPGGDYISIPTVGGIWEKGLTVCAWTKFTQPRSFERIIDFGEGIGEKGGLPFVFGREGESNKIFFESWIDTDPYENRSKGRISYPAIENGKFRFYCATVENIGQDEGVMRLYVDGKLVARKRGNGIKNTVRARNYIAHSNWCMNDPDFRGIIDEVRLYNRPLSQEEIKELYESTKPESPKETNVFGTKKETPFVFEGKVYPLNPGTNRLPDFSKLKSIGTIYTPTLNVSPRDFREGFPGVTDRFEWFAIDYRGQIFIPTDREFTFFLLSDDGAKLIIDGKTVIDNDGIHPPAERSGKVKLKKGTHTIEVQYFQGPKYQVALVLSYLKNGKKVPFDIREFAPVKIEESKCKVNLTLSSGILFDFNSYALKPEAIKVLDEVVDYIKKTPYTKVIVEGHTDNIGSDAYNLKLSKMRAQAVANYMIAKGIPSGRIEVVGYGKTRPKYPNTTEEYRAKNRRVEIKLIKPCKD